MNKVINLEYKHAFMGLITMERLIESILSITIMDEKDIDRSHHSEATSMHSHMDHHLNWQHVSDEIDHSMDLSMRDIS